MPLILPPYVGKPDYYKRLSAGAVGANSASAQPWFPTAGSLSLPGARLLRVYGKIWLDHGTTSHTTALVFGGTLTVTSLSLVARHHVLSPNNTATGGNTTLVTQVASTIISAAVTTANEFFEFFGHIITNVAGTLIPQFQFNTDPTGTITIGVNTLFSV